MSNIPAIPRRDFFEIQADLEKVTAKLKGAKDPDARRKLLREMRALLGEASRARRVDGQIAETFALRKTSTQFRPLELPQGGGPQ